MTTDVMIDLETLDTAVTAKILSVGVCFFDIATGKIHRAWETPVLLTGQEQRTMNDSTFRWWMNQEPDAQKRVSGPAKHVLYEAMYTIAHSMRDLKDLRVWGNGATFDISILEHAFNEYGIPVPWNFRNVRDMRTLVEVGQMITGTDICAKVPFEGVNHSAVDDAVWQAKVVSEIWKVLG